MLTAFWLLLAAFLNNDAHILSGTVPALLSVFETVTFAHVSGHDIALWRAVRLSQLDPGSAPAAAMFAATLPLLLTYPPEIRDRLLPLVAETLVAGG